MADDTSQTVIRNSIQPLPLHVSARILATKHIISVKSVILGLLQNSLDAGASKIEVTVGFRRRSCKIEDNGHGISAEEFEERGGLFKRYHTSKVVQYAAGEVHSCDGTFLTSVATVSYMSITSRTKDKENPAFIALHQGDVLSRSISTSASHNFPSIHSGTRVVVDDIFGNMPVRVKHHSATESSTLFSDLKYGIVATLLAWNKPVALRLQHADDREKYTYLAASHPSISHDVTSRALTGLSRSLTLQDKLTLLFQAGYATWDSKKHWISVSANNTKYSVKGVICNQPAPSKHCQFISISLCTLDKAESILYQAINKVFAASSFGCVYEDEMSIEKPGSQRVRNNVKLAKGADKWPMFVFTIEPRKAGQIAVNEATVSKLTTLLEDIVEQWLVVHCHQAKRKRRLRSLMQDRPTLSQPIPGRPRVVGLPGKNNETLDDVPTHLDNTWTRIKTAKPLTSSTSRPTTAPDEATASTNEKQHFRIRQHTAPLLGSPMLDGHSILPPFVNECQVSEEYVKWQDPATRQEFLVDLRTGMTKPLSAIFHEARSQSTTAIEHKLPEALQNWQPTLFVAPAEDRIPRSVSIDPFERSSLSTGYISPNRKFSKHELQQAHIIAQVDSKFILCSIPDNAAVDFTYHLVLIDQHAASERAILEKLLIELCGQDTGLLLDEPIIFETSTQEGRILEKAISTFATWNIVYEIVDTSAAVRATRVIIRALPSVIAERCRLQPRIIIELLRTEVWQAKTRSKIYNTSADSTPWVQRLGNCPKGILDLVNSRACRSAIMFNDYLSKESCTKLVQDLAETVFPFMCAHGRTSVVPVLGIACEKSIPSTIDYNLSGFDTQSPTETFTSAYSRWTRSSD